MSSQISPMLKFRLCDITRKLSLAIGSLCSVLDEGVVGLLTLRCYGCYKVLNSLSSFSQPDVKARVQRN